MSKPDRRPESRRPVLMRVFSRRIGAADRTVCQAAGHRRQDGAAAGLLSSLPCRRRRRRNLPTPCSRRGAVRPPVPRLPEPDGSATSAPSARTRSRDHGLICVVAEPKDVIAMERAREYHGVYHVLHGVISPLNHIGPDDIRIRELLDARRPGAACARSSWPPTPTRRARPPPCIFPACCGRWRCAVTRLGLRHPRGQPAGICRRGHASARARGQKRHLKKTLRSNRGPQRFFYHFMGLSAPFRGRTGPVCRGRSARR